MVFLGKETARALIHVNFTEPNNILLFETSKNLHLISEVIQIKIFKISGL
jgi:hypothetical protein